jgi:ferredoxin
MSDGPTKLRIQVIDSAGREHAIECVSGMTLMEAVRGAGLPLEATCGGSLACATCHVVVDPTFYEHVGSPSEDEEDMLDQGFNVTRTSRLACQITMEPKLDRLQIRLPELVCRRVGPRKLSHLSASASTKS